MTTPPETNLAQSLLAAAAGSRSPDEFDAAALAGVCQAIEAPAAALWRPDPPHWRLLASAPAGQGGEPPEAVIEALDQERPVALGGWSAVPTAPPAGDVERTQPDVLAIRATADPAAAGRLAELLHSARTVARRRRRAERRSERLDELLTISLEWGATSDTAALLDRMADAATRLFDSDRATIFLWDRRASRLVGRPALGMPNNELAIADDVGLVGRVVQSGEPMRSDPGDDGLIDRSTDQATGYQTRSLLCVPLDGPDGERLGAFELINKLDSSGKPGAGFSDEDQRGLTEFARLAAIAVANAQQVEELIEQRDALVDQAASGVRMLGESPAIVALRKTLERVADSDLAVLVLGENGTGKEVVAQSLHFQSRRRNEPLLAVNCAAIAESLLESELFGHEAGAFTDARESRAGKFELADGGTILLDEIGDMSAGGQAKLLRVLEDKTVVRVGGAEARKVDVRVVAATNRDLAARVSEGAFREDLFYRLNVVTIELPPLRDRGGDPVLLGEHFLKHFSKARGRRAPKLSAAAKKRLASHTWPGNIRELRNLMERVAYLTDGSTVDEADLSIIDRGGDSPGGDAQIEGTLTEATHEFQRRLIGRLIDRHRGNVSAAARDLGVHRSNLYRKMGQLGMKGVEE